MGPSQLLLDSIRQGLGREEIGALAGRLLGCRPLTGLEGAETTASAPAERGPEARLAALEGRVRALKVAAAKADDVHGPSDPEVEPARKPAKKITKKKSKSTKEKATMATMSHAEKMLSWPAYRRAFNDAVAMRDPSAPMSKGTRARLAERGRAYAFGAGGIMGQASSGEAPRQRSIAELSEADRIGVRAGFDGEEGVRAARAGLEGVTTTQGRMFVSSRNEAAPAPTLAKAQRALADAKAKAGVL